MNQQRTQVVLKALEEQPLQLPHVEILNEDQRIFKCWGSVEVKDSHGEIIMMDEFKRVMPVIVERGGVLMEMHTNRHIGKILNYEFKEKRTNVGERDGIMLTCKVFENYPYDDWVWDGVKKGRYKGLSFGGFNRSKEFTSKDNAMALKGIEGLEFSLVDDPANKEATMEAINFFAKRKDVAKGPLCMQALTGRGFSETDAHNICYADDIADGRKEPMVENSEVQKPAALDRCVADLMADPDFKPKDPKDTKEQAAFAVCTAAMNKRDDTDEVYKSDIAKAVNYLSKDDLSDISQGGKTPMANPNKKTIKKQDGEDMPQESELTLESLAERMSRQEESLTNIQSMLTELSEKKAADDGPAEEEEEARKTAGTGPDSAKDTDVAQDEDESPGDPETDSAEAIKSVEKRLTKNMNSQFSDLKKSLGLGNSSTPRPGAATKERTEVRKKTEDEPAEKGTPSINPYDLVTGKMAPNLNSFAKSNNDSIRRAQEEALGYN